MPLGKPAAQANRIVRFSRVVADLTVASRFYGEALGFSVVAEGRVDESTLRALDVDGGADEVVMRLEQQEIALVRFDRPGRLYPADSRSNDLWFQHLAVVVADMNAAFRQVSAERDLTAISEGGPQLLPPENGSVRAFKFRDPDGHPLELLWFPPERGRPLWHAPADRLFLGIDHSALSVTSAHESLTFYTDLGFVMADTTLNQGTAQSRLDGFADARVGVTGLRPLSDPGPGLELLEYSPPGRSLGETSARDSATDWVTLAGGQPGALSSMRDPDGHRFLATGLVRSALGSQPLDR